MVANVYVFLTLSCMPLFTVSLAAIVNKKNCLRCRSYRRASIASWTKTIHFPFAYVKVQYFGARFKVADPSTVYGLPEKKTMGVFSCSHGRTSTYLHSYSNWPNNGWIDGSKRLEKNCAPVCGFASGIS